MEEEKERVLIRKREATGSSSRRKVFEAKKEKKKRRLILSDSESDDDKFVISLRSRGPDQNVGSSPVEDEIVVEDNRVEVAGGLVSEVVKQRGEDDGAKKLLDASSDNRDEEMKVKAERVLDASMNGEKSGDGMRREVESIKLSEDVAASGDAENSSIDTSVKKEDSQCRLATTEWKGGEAVGSNKSLDVSDAHQNGTASPIEEMGSGDRPSREEMMMERKWVSRSDVVEKEGEEVDSCKESATSGVKVDDSFVKNKDELHLANKEKLELERVSSKEIGKEREADDRVEDDIDSPVKRMDNKDKSGNKEKRKLEEKTVSRSEGTEKGEGEEGDNSKKAPATSKVNGNGSFMKKNDNNSSLASVEERKLELKRSEVDKKRKETDGARENGIEKDNREKEGKLEAGRVSSLKVREMEDAIDYKKGSHRNGTNYLREKGDRRDGSSRETEIKVEAKRVSRWDIVEMKDEGKRISRWDIVKMKDEGKRSSRWDVKMKDEGKRVSRWDVKVKDEEKRVSRWDVKMKDEDGSCKKVPATSIAHHNGDGNNIGKEEIKAETERVTKSEITKKSEENNGDKKIPDVSGADHLGKRDKKVPVTSRADHLQKSSSMKKKNSIDVPSKDDMKVKKREGSDFVRKENMEFVSDRKRSRDTFEAENSMKKMKSEDTNCRCEKGNETGGRSSNRDFLKRADSRTSAGADRFLGSNKKSFQATAEKIDIPRTKTGRWIERSGGRSLRKLKDNSQPSGDIRREQVGISQHKGIRMHGKADVLPNDKKVGRLEKVGLLEETTNRVLKQPKVSGDGKVSNVKLESKQLNPNPGKGSLEAEENTNRVLKQPKVSGDGKVSNVKLESKQLNPNPGKGSLEGRSKSCKVTTEPETFSSETKLKNKKADGKTKEEFKSKLKSSVLTEQNANETTAGKVRLTDKQKVREQIKEILLDAGWKIDLRPRRGRNYEDSVYIPPFGGAGYWSITKAYAVYQEKCKSGEDEKSKDVSIKSSKISTGSDQSHEGASSTLTAIPTNLLSMLKRNVINKRRQRTENHGIQKKLGIRKKGKGISSKKDSKNTQRKNDGKVLKKMDNGGSKLRKKTTGVATASFTAQKPHLRARIRNQRGCCPLVRGAEQDVEADLDDYVPYPWKRTIFSWMIDLDILHINGKVRYMNKDESQAMMEGWITRDGIRCSCCSKTITVSKFEIHAGSKLGQPHQNIYVKDTGTSLLQCQLDAWEKENSELDGFHTVNIEGDDPNDDTCGICGDGGDLICCDRCPSTFHLNCLGIEMLPPGDWLCTYCSCKFCGSVSDGTYEGSDSTILLSCSQCEKKYHQECIPESDSISVGHNILGTSFCGQTCCMVFKQLQKRLGIKNDLEAGLSWRLVRRLDEDSSGFRQCLPQWAECNSKSAVALAVMDECFLPIIDQRSGVNLIHNIVYNYGSNITRLSYSGFYTFILEREEEIIAAASVRIHGTRLAEMPFIGTREMYRRQGMCRQLLNGIESALYSLNVEKLIIPAISELTETWTNVFGFKPLEQSEKAEVRSINMLVFPGTGLLQKPILKMDSAEQHGTSKRAEHVEPVIKNHLTTEAANEAPVLSSGQCSPCGSDKVVHSKNKVKNIHIINPKTGDSDASYESKSQDPNSKSSKAAADVDLLFQAEVVCHGDLMGGDEFHVSSNELKIAVPSEGAVDAYHKGRNKDTAVASSLYVVDGTSVRHSSAIDHQKSLLEGSGFPVFSSSPDEVHPEHELNVLAHTPKDESTSTRKSESETPDCMSSETALSNLFPETNVVCDTEPVGRDTFSTNSSNELKHGLACESTLHESHSEYDSGKPVPLILGESGPCRVMLNRPNAKSENALVPDVHCGTAEFPGSSSAEDVDAIDGVSNCTGAISVCQTSKVVIRD